MNVFPRLEWRDLPWLLPALLAHIWRELTTGHPGCTVPAMQHDGLREISLRPSHERPPTKPSDPPNVKLGSLALQKVENIVVIAAVTAGWLHFHACDFEQWVTVVGVTCGLATLGPKLGDVTRAGPRSLGALIAYWWHR